MSPATAARRHLLRRALGVAGAAIGVLVVFVAAAVLGAFLHVDSPPARRLLVTQVNAVMKSTFEGKLVLDGVGGVGTWGVVGLRARVLDPEGKQVLLAEGVRARIRVLGLLRAALLGSGTLDIELDEVAVDHVDASLDVGKDNKLGIARAFALRSTTPSAAPGREVRVIIKKATIQHAWAHGRPSPSLAIDADVDQVIGSVHVTPKETTIDVGHAVIVTRSMPNGADAAGELTGKLSVPGGDEGKIAADASFLGSIAQIPATLRGSIHGNDLLATVDVSGVPAERIRALVPSLPLTQPVTAHVEARGELSKIDATAEMTVEGAPLNAAADISIQEGSLGGNFTLRSGPRALMGTAIPAVDLRGDFSLPTGASAPKVHVEGSVAEVGAPSNIAVDLRPEGRSFVVEFSVKTTIPDLAKVARIGPVASGRADVAASGSFHVADGILDAKLTGDVHDVAVGPARISVAHVTAHAKGSARDPFVDALVTLERVDAGGLTYEEGSATARGPALAPDVNLDLHGARGAVVSARAKLGISPELSARSVGLAMTREGVALLSSVDSVRFAGGALELEGATIDGIGDRIQGSFRRAPGSLTVRASSAGVDLQRLALFLGKGNIVRGGRVAFDVDGKLEPRSADGHVTVDLQRGSILGLIEGVMHLDATVSGRKVDATLQAGVKELGEAQIETKGLELGPGSLTDASSWKKASGTVQAELNVDLAKLVRWFPPDLVPVDNVSGRLLAKGKLVRRSESDMTPDVHVELKTAGLAFAGKSSAPPDPSDVLETPIAPWRVAGIDVELVADAGGDKGAFALTARLADKVGALVDVAANSDAVPYRELLLSDGDRLQELADVPFTAKVSIPRRDLRALPPPLSAQGDQGAVEATFEVHGTALKPELTLDAKIDGFRSHDAPILVPLSGVITASYAGDRGTAQATISTPRARVLDASAKVEGALLQAVSKRSSDVSWTGSAHVALSSFPLGAVTPLSDLQIKGHVSGDMTIDGLHRDAKANATLNLEDLSIATAKYPKGHVTLSVDSGVLRATARLDQSDGYASATAAAGATWGTKMLPSLDRTKRLQASFEAKQFRAAALQAFVGAVSELDGRIDGKASVDLGPNDAKPELRGSVTLSDGLFELASGGGEFHGVAGKMVLSPDGVVRIQDVVAYGVTGKVMASATGRVQGLGLVAANAAIRIPKKDALPLDVEGTSLGYVYGDVDIKAVSAGEDAPMKVDVSVPVAHVTLPQSASHKVQALGEPKHVHVGVYTAARQFAALAIDGEDIDEAAPAPTSAGREIDMTVHLGNDIEIRRGTDLRVALTGTPEVKISRRTRVSGQIQLKSGTLVVQGKKFEIEKGTVTFQGNDPGNPMVVVTAGWNAQDGTRVYADFVGPLKTGKVVLRSEPARPKNEILALIMFGTADGSAGTPYASTQPDTATKAGTTVGSFATAGLSEGLDALTGLDIQTKIDTTDAANPRPEVEIQIARDISLQLAFILGTPPPGSNPDRTFATIHWRFRRNWSLETTFGDQGSSIADVIWQYRY